MLNALERDLCEAGYVRNPNNIYGLSGSMWYPGSGGIPCPPQGQQVQVTTIIRVFEPVLVGEPYKRGSYYDCRTVATYPDVTSFLDDCCQHGRLSEEGQCANVWD